MSSHDSGARCDSWIPRCNHAAFAGRDGLVRVKAEDTGVGLPGADQASVPVGRQRMSRVFNDFEAAAASELKNGGDIAGPATKMNGGDRLAPRRPFPFCVIKINREGLRIDVDKDDVGAKMTEGSGRRRES